jgi:hypothetical protein
MISIEGSPVTKWTVVLERAIVEGKMDTLLREVLRIYPESKLADAVQHYKTALESGAES